MQFDSLLELWQMHSNGRPHGPFVWSAYFIFLIVVVYLIVSPLRRTRQLLEQQRRQARREQRDSQTARADASQQTPSKHF